MREVVELRPGERRYTLRTADGAEFEAAAVVLAGGVSYRRLEIPALAALEGTGVFYGASGGRREGARRAAGLRRRRRQLGRPGGDAPRPAGRSR